VTTREALVGIVLDEHVTLTVHEVCEVCGIEESVVIEMVKEGVAEPVDDAASTMEFSGVAVTRILTAHRLQRDLHINLPGAALAIDLMEEIRRLKRK
jgi:chaperone modulatory protein CbpM